jgi:hypothetical protein
MDRIIQLDAYRKRRQQAAESAKRRQIWACGRCGGWTWTVSVEHELRCAECDTRAGNREVLACADPHGMHQ